MELLCVERLAEPKCATAHDPAIFRDMRAFASLLAEETLAMPPCDYFRCVQTEMRPYMRKVVATWMMEVCEEQRCEDTVFPLAANLLDRFLCRCRVPKQQLQLLGAAALLVASKLRQSQPLAVDLLCYYTDDAFRPEDLHAWELLLVTKLEWRLSAVTALDCADHALQRLPWAGQSPLLRAHAHTLVSVCCTEPQFVLARPSLLAAACIASAARGLRLPCAASALRDACSLLGAAPEPQAEAACSQLELLLAGHAAAMQAAAAGRPCSRLAAAAAAASKQPPPAAVDDDKPETPTDVQSVHF